MRAGLTGSLVFGVTTGVGVAGWYEGHLSNLAQAGVDVTLITPQEAGIREFAERQGARHEHLAFRRRPSPLHDLGAVLRLVRMLRRVRPDAAVWASPKAGLLGTIAGRLTSIPSAYIVHGVRYETQSGVQRLVLKAMERVACRLATVVVPIGTGVRGRLASDGIVALQHMRMVGYGSINGAPPYDSMTQHEGRRRLGIPEQATVLAFVGRLNQDKGVPDLLQAWAEADLPARSILILAGEMEDEETLGTVISRTQGVVYLGYVQTIEAVYCSADALVLPSLREGVPTAVLAASWLGVPSIVTWATGVCEASVDGETGLVIEPKNVAALREALERMMWDESAREAWGRGARRLVHERYDRARVQAAWQDFYLSLLQEGPSA